MPSAEHTIYLLDDEPCVLKALGRLLASAGFAVAKFTEPTLFLEHAREHPMRVAVMDIRMPGMTGLEVLAELRDFSPETRVIMMTGESKDAYRDAALEWGACAFLSKPFDDEVILAAVRSALDHSPGSDQRG